MEDRFNFRAFIPKYKKMVEVYKFGYDGGSCEWVWHNNIYDTFDGDPVMDKWGTIIFHESNVINRTKLYYCKLMQCTGLRDKNGKLIYEGDIVKLENKETAIVYWNNGQWILRHGGKDGYNVLHCMEEFKEMEIIGNIHENLELIKD